MRLDRAPRHLLFDLDGTLLGSRPTLKGAFLWEASRFFRRRGHGAWGGIQALRSMRVALETPGTGIRNDCRAAAALSEALGLSEDEASELMLAMVGEVFPRLERQFYPIPGAREFLDWCAPRFGMSLATNPVWPLEIVLLRLKWAGLEPSRFERISHAGMMHSCKPSVSYFRELLVALGLRGEECLLVGDSLRKDLPGLGAGIPVYLLGRSGKVRELAFPKALIDPEEPASARARAFRGSYGGLKRLLEGGTT